MSQGSQGYVYFFQDCEALDQRVKIGKSDDPRRRLRDLKRLVKHQLTVIGVMPSDEPLAEETVIHRLCAEHHIEGEWFNAAVLAKIEAYRSRFLEKLPESPALVQVWVSPEAYAACVSRAKSEGRSLANWFRHELHKIAGTEE